MYILFLPVRDYWLLFYFYFIGGKILDLTVLSRVCDIFIRWCLVVYLVLNGILRSCLYICTTVIFFFCYIKWVFIYGSFFSFRGLENEVFYCGAKKLFLREITVSGSLLSIFICMQFISYCLIRTILLIVV
jgi:hypothetical protein